MNASFEVGRCGGVVLFAFLAATAVTAPAVGQPTFVSFDPRLPNPDQPYVMEGNAVFGNAEISGLELRITNPSQLNAPHPVSNGYAFDSMFDVAFSAFLGIGGAPSVPVSGDGTAHVTGFAPSGMEPMFEFETEMVALQLMGTSPFGDFMIRESPTERSSGVTTVDGACYGPICLAVANGPAVVLPIHISSFFDVSAEQSLDGGATWTPSVSSFRLVQTPEPASAWLILCGMGFAILERRKSPC